MVHGIIIETMITLVYRETQLYIILNYRCVKIVFKKKKTPEEQQAKQSPIQCLFWLSNCMKYIYKCVDLQKMYVTNR